MTLQEKGEQIVQKLDLINVLSAFGEAHLVGNLALGTTIKPDIDVQIYTELHYEELAPSVAEALKKLGFHDIKARRLSKSKKYLILAKIDTEGTSWELDVTLTGKSPDHVRDSYQFVLDYQDKLTDDNRELIKKFKDEFKDMKIRGDNSAYYIYLGVLEAGVKKSGMMRKYLSKVKYGEDQEK